MARKDVQTSNLQAAQNSAVINPYALAELIAGRKIAWREIADAPCVLEDILHYSFDPCHRTKPTAIHQHGALLQA